MVKGKTVRKTHKIAALLFDFGGTLAFLDFEGLAREFSKPGGRKLTALGLEHAEYDGRAAVDRYLLSGPRTSLEKAYQEYLRSWMLAAGIPDDEIKAVAKRFLELHREACLWRVVRPGTLETLERLKSAGFKLGVVSNADGRVEADARRMGLSKFFDVIIDSQVVGVHKPDPRIFRIALERLGVAASEAIYAGDMYSIDMLGARAAGMAGKLIDQHRRYDWVEHEKIRDVSELY